MKSRARVSSEHGGQSGVEERTQAAGAPGAVEVVPEEVVDFIRYCYRRRGIGWPELYDEMCAVAARGEYGGVDYDRLNDLGLGFSVAQLPRLAQLARQVVAAERAERVRELRSVDARPDPTAPRWLSSPATG
jgi:hypothetical protein